MPVKRCIKSWINRNFHHWNVLLGEKNLKQINYSKKISKTPKNKEISKKTSHLNRKIRVKKNSNYSWIIFERLTRFRTNLVHHTQVTANNRYAHPYLLSKAWFKKKHTKTKAIRAFEPTSASKSDNSTCFLLKQLIIKLVSAIFWNSYIENKQASKQLCFWFILIILLFSVLLLQIPMNK